MSFLLVVFFLLTILIQLGYWVIYYKSLASFNFSVEKSLHQFPGVSVIICYKNESAQIVNTVNSVLRQDYPELEVIAVNDFSTDDGPERVKKIKDKRLMPLHAKVDIPGKKYALKDAVSNASFDWILVTDADCMPASDDWIQTMLSAQIKENADVVLGYSPMRKSRELISKFSSFETLMTALQYLTFTLNKKPYMGVGRNLLYRKSVFRKYADESYFSLPAGDDDLLIQKAGIHEKVTVCFDKSAWVYTNPKTSLMEFIYQKARHIGVSTHYSFKIQIILTLYAMTAMMIFPLGFIIWILGLISLKWLIPIFTFKWIIQHFCHRKYFEYMSPETTKYYPIFELANLIFLWLMSFIIIFMKKRAW